MIRRRLMLLLRRPAQDEKEEGRHRQLEEERAETREKARLTMRLSVSLSVMAASSTWSTQAPGSLTRCAPSFRRHVASSSQALFFNDAQKTCALKRPPGRKVYQRGAHIIWEVDGAAAKVRYCLARVPLPRPC